MNTQTKSRNKIEKLKRYSYGLAILWIAIVFSSLAWNLIEVNRNTLETARIQARVAHLKDVDYRSWNAAHGGVYVPVTPEIQPNPYLKTPRRDLVSPSGQHLTLINPAYMTRMVHNIGEHRYGVRGHITSLKPIRPHNAADKWETSALKQFESGVDEVSSVVNMDGTSYMRLMRPLVTEKGCLQCHLKQGYKVGDIRGGISVAVPMEPLWVASQKQVLALVFGHTLLGVLGLLGVYVGATRLTNSFQELELSEANLRQSEEQYRLLFENAGVLVSVYDRDGTCLLVNESEADCFEVSSGELAGKSIHELHPEAAGEYVRRIFEVMDSGQPKLIEDLVTFPRGQRWLLSNVHPTKDPEGEVVGVQVVSQDITDRKNAEELRRTVERFSAVSDLANGVAHNFNNLLQIVTGHLQLSILDLENKDYTLVKETLEKVLERARTAATTVERLQAFAGIRGSVSPAKSERFDLAPVAKHAVEMSKTWWEELSAEEEVRISVVFRSQTGCFVNGDENQLFSVVLCLIRNGVEAVKKAGGGEVSIDSSVIDGRVILSVKDEGVGIEDDDRERIFNPFFTTKADQGSGLSLATSREIIVRHGGQIRVESEVGKGATFTVVLPFSGEPASEKKALPQPVPNRALTVLVVDDEPAIVKLLESWTKKRGYRAVSALSGADALHLYNETSVDVVVCDLGMPGMSGWEVGRRIREICEERGVPKTPFIILTGWRGEKIAAVKIIESGVDAVAEKPLNMRALFEIIEQTVDRRTEESPGPRVG